ncbi:ZIP family metal transporter [Acholeplasma sp. OttesenSCG-928-E16]|nr:ZIP family metal transporter [Acholeplasma sp. OttesenSCG-928-E16]
MEWFSGLDSWLQALLAALFTWGMTALGAAMVFFFKKINKGFLNLMLGFASGVMIAASFWSLLQPAINMVDDNNSKVPSWLIVSIGFALGGLVLFIADKVVPHIHRGAKEAEGRPSKLKRNILLVFSITLHNIPEGLAVGVAFGAIAHGTGSDSAALYGALSLAIGMGIQNFPEGAAVSIPLRQEGMSRSKSFFYGQLSGIVEPIAAVLGVLLVTYVKDLLPYALAFAAGAMIYVVADELIPEAKQTENSKQEHLSILGLMIGFIIMMILDVSLG